MPPEHLHALVVVFAGLFGLVIGSFLNVVALRVPAGKSIVSPGSHCPACGGAIRWYDNIPVLSFVLLGGKCRYCRARISVQYPAVELATGILFGVAALQRGPSLLLLRDMVFIGAMVVTVVADLRFWIVLDQVSMGGTAAGIGFSLLPGGVGIVGSVLSAAGAFALFLLIRVVASRFLAGRPGYTIAPEGFEENGEGFEGGMGWGDVKLAACMGAFLGPERTVVALFAAFLTGALTGLSLILFRGRNKRVPVPFGPFLALGSILSLFAGDTLWKLYTGLGAGGW